MRKIFSLTIVIVLCLPGCFSARSQKGIHLDKIKMPPGFKISMYARIPGARSMALSSGGILFVGTRKQGSVYAVLDRNKDHAADKVITVAKGLHMHNGVAFRNGALYVAEVSRVLRYDGIEMDPGNPPDPAVLNSSGYRIMRLRLEDNHAVEYAMFAQGWLRNDRA